LQIRQGHWAIVDMVGKGGHVRTVPVPAWAKQAVDRWRESAKVMAGRFFRAVSRPGTPRGKGISENVLCYVVRGCAERMQLDHLAPYDLRRTCTRLCHVNGGELEQIQFLLGHVFRAYDGAISGVQAVSSRPCKRSFRLSLRSDNRGLTVRAVSAC
jgi:integrase